MSTLAALAAILAAVLLVVAYRWWRGRCERLCLTAEEEAQILFHRGDLLGALQRIDETDALCGCGRFTSGDAPPLYALAVAALQRLRADGRAGEVERIASRARGPILRGLLNDDGG